MNVIIKHGVVDQTIHHLREQGSKEQQWEEEEQAVAGEVRTMGTI